MPPDLAAGTYRVRIRSKGYDLPSAPFEVVPNDDLKPLGVQVRALKRKRTQLVLLAQNPAPDPARAITYRDVSPTGGRAVLRLGKRRVVARWNARARGWVAVVRGRVAPGTTLVLPARGLRDRTGNVNGAAATLKAGEVAQAAWPRTMGVGGGRPPGPTGQGTFPP